MPPKTSNNSKAFRKDNSVLVYRKLKFKGNENCPRSHRGWEKSHETLKSGHFPTALLPSPVGSAEGERKVTRSQGGQERNRDRNRDWDSPKELEWAVLA